MLRMEEQTKPLFLELKQEKEKLDWKNECKQLFYGDTTPQKGDFLVFVDLFGRTCLQNILKYG